MCKNAKCRSFRSWYVHFNAEHEIDAGQSSVERVDAARQHVDGQRVVALPQVVGHERLGVVETATQQLRVDVDLYEEAAVVNTMRNDEKK